MRYSFNALYVLLACLMLVSVSANAKLYLTFELGKASKNDVMAQLDSAQARYSVDYGYQGYASDLPVIKVNQFEGFAKYGAVNSAWLYFSPDNVLYKISVEYADRGEIYRVFNDSLNGKYGMASHSGFGFKKVQTYLDEDTRISLTRDEFGFGNDQKTTLEYEFQPLLPAVSLMRVRIDKIISEQNAAKAGDL